MKAKMFLYFILFSACVSVLVIQINCGQQPEKKEMTQEELIQKGEYLVNIGGCNDCHTPKVFNEMGMMEDTTRLLSGHPQDMPLQEFDKNIVEPGKWYLVNSHLTAWVGPWGVSFARNLTPDGPTGLGNWTEEIFIKAMRTGKTMGAGRPILPPMPWFNLAKLPDEDLKAIFAYLKSLKPVKNQVPDAIMLDQMASK
jgi:mono/diheme cytochrome c family protein